MFYWHFYSLDCWNHLRYGSRLFQLARFPRQGPGGARQNERTRKNSRAGYCHRAWEATPFNLTRAAGCAACHSGKNIRAHISTNGARQNERTRKNSRAGFATALEKQHHSISHALLAALPVTQVLILMKAMRVVRVFIFGVCKTKCTHRGKRSRKRLPLRLRKQHHSIFNALLSALPVIQVSMVMKVYALRVKCVFTAWCVHARRESFEWESHRRAPEATSHAFRCWRRCLLFWDMHAHRFWWLWAIFRVSPTWKWLVNVYVIQGTTYTG